MVLLKKEMGSWNRNLLKNTVNMSSEKGSFRSTICCLVQQKEIKLNLFANVEIYFISNRKVCQAAKPN